MLGFGAVSVTTPWASRSMVFKGVVGHLELCELLGLVVKSWHKNGPLGPSNSQYSSVRWWDMVSVMQ